MTAGRTPPISDDARPFWDATASRRLVLPWCTDCGRAIWYPRSVCPHCLGEDIEWRESAGRGTVYACSVHGRRAADGEGEDDRYVVALVDLEDGVRMMSNVVGCDPDDVSVGAPLRLSWSPLDDGRHLPVFEAI